MLDLFTPLKGLLQSEPVRVDNFVFRLHSRLTVVILSVCAILVTAKQYFGEPISCIPDASIAKEPVNAYCWIYSTFTVARHLRGVPGRDIASPGVGQALEDDEIHYHRYYQWVCFVLTLQAILFYAPRALWGVWEAGTVGHLARDLAAPFPRDTFTQERKRQLVEYFAVTAIHTHNFYAFRFLVCELLNFLNAIGQIYLLDVFLEGQFTSYGPSVTAFSVETKPFERVDPMARLFPKITKCTIHTYGSGGSPQTLDALCVLTLNIVNEKIFIFVWFWLVFLSGISALAVCYRYEIDRDNRRRSQQALPVFNAQRSSRVFRGIIVRYFLARVRRIVLFTQPWSRVYLLRAVARVLSQTKAETLVAELRFGDWFLLYQLAHNVNPIVYRELVNEIAGALANKCVL